MRKLKKGDKVIVIKGKEKGKQGEISSILDNGSKVIVNGVNLVKKSVKANPNNNEPGGYIDKHMPIDRSNVMLYDAEKNKGSRVGIRILSDGQRVRFLKKSDQLVDVKK